MEPGDPVEVTGTIDPIKGAGFAVPVPTSLRGGGVESFDYILTLFSGQSQVQICKIENSTSGN